MQTEALIASPHPAADAAPGREPGEILPVVDVVVVAGPPVIFIAAPWLFFGLMLAAPFAVVTALAAVFVAAAVAVVALGALLAAPVLLVRHLRHHPLRTVRAASARPAVRLSAARLWPAGA